MSSVSILIPACHRLDHQKKLQKTEEVVSIGHLGASWMTSTLRMTSLSSHTATNRCRMQWQHSYDSTSTEAKQRL